MPGHERLLQRMRQTPNGWSQKDFDKLLTGMGFDKRDGGSHTIYSHRLIPTRLTIGRHNELAPFFTKQVLAAIEELQAAIEQERLSQGNDPNGNT